MKTNLIAFILVVLGACATPKNESEDNIFINLDGSVAGKTSDIVDSFDYLLIDYSEDFPIVQPYRILFYENLIFIEDNTQNHIFIIDQNGKVLNVIKSQGNGPRQFSYIDDFQVEKNKILIKDTLLDKFIAFDFQGNFLYEEKASNKAIDFYAAKDFKLHFFSNRLNQGEFNLVKENIEGKIIEQNYPPKEGYAGRKIFSLEQDFIEDKTKKQIVLKIPFSYDIAFFDLNGDLQKIKTFDFGPYNLSDSDRLFFSNGRFDDAPEDEYSNLVEYINQFFAVGNKYYMFLTKGRKESHLILLDRGLNPQNQYLKIENDLDGLPIINFPRWQREGQLVQRLSSTTFLNNYLRNEDLLKSKFPEAKIHDFVEKNRYKLERDWLVLIFWNLKE
ncbi:6-bladed beta-propeller [Algoriphagus marinus]|uniref:6-bladed beta-propeller n=1 Tax=Algoriphagus marinus TaxID=1925762 RepID=UPI00094B7F28|nr:6-bladed beta-propeller [Algoriphagus marinus]